MQLNPPNQTTAEGGYRMESTDISQILYDQNPEYRTLFDQHRSLETRLQDLSSRLYLSDSEKLEEVELKKKKLALKDRMQQMMKTHHA